MKKIILILFVSVNLLRSQSTTNSYTQTARFLSSDFLQMYQGARLAAPTMTLPNSLTTYTSSLGFGSTDNRQLYNAIRGIGGAISSLTSSASGWGLSGNAVNSNTAFIGSNDNFPFNIKVNANKSGLIDTIGSAFFGYKSGRFNTDNGSTGIGYKALSTNTAAAGNTAIGHQAMQTSTNGGYNTAVGRNALTINQGDQNSALGNGALGSNTTGSYNTSLGTISLLNNTTGSFNTAIGVQALNGCVTSSYNIAIGYLAMQTATSGNNLAIGFQALNRTTGGNNVALGYNSLTNQTTGSGNISIGHYSGAYETTRSNRLFINSIIRNDILGDTTKSIIYGYQHTNVGSQRLYINSQLSVSSTATLQSNSMISTNLIGAVLKASATLDFPNTTSGNVSDLTLTCTGATDGDVVSLGTEANVRTANGGIYDAWVSSANTVTIRFHNSTGAAVNPASGTYKVIVHKN